MISALDNARPAAATAQLSPSPSTGEGRGEGGGTTLDAATPHPQPLSHKARGEVSESEKMSTAGSADGVSWQQALKDAVRDPRQLCELLDLPQHWVPAAIEAAKQFPLFVPRPYLARIERGNPHDPLLRQVLPLEEELSSPPNFTHDPVGDMAAQQAPGMLQKYQGRVLLVTTGACAVHCRYCFRRHFPYSAASAGSHSASGSASGTTAAWQPALDAIAADDSLHEVILSGGDPLVLVDSLLADLAERLAAIPHLKRLRVHTRLPVMIPQRVDAALLAWLRGTRLVPVMVIHANHPAELQGSAGAAIERLVNAGVPVLNQSVLLAGVNDNVDVLAALSERLVDLRAMPYYLHQLDRVAGAAHFEVPVARGLELIATLRRRLPGYAVPRYVQEVTGQPHKVTLEALETFD